RGGRNLAGVQPTGIGDAVVDHHGGRRLVVPHEFVELGDVDERDVTTVRHRVHTVYRKRARGGVLDVNGRNVVTESTAQPAFGQLELLGPLQHDQVDVFVAQPA